ncbi:hypothetical protein UY3_04655 [Chelonia mydas]|uniref:Myb/SANT-like DNA-binding domain-containing protein n=1 Tax=Chelonia mydas TaxID=8469 RepID=M7BLQ4_CHEMY|nr:hypothetical protein UY3_04655 [Chelonia mydas]
MGDRGYSSDATQCSVKLKELRQVYQKTKESNGHSGTGPQTCRFYAELHAVLGGAATTTPPLSMDSDERVLSAMPEDFVYGEDEEEEDELEESTQHTVLPDSQDLFITLTEIPSQPNEAGEGTSATADNRFTPFFLGYPCRCHSMASMDPTQLTTAVVSIVNTSHIILQYVHNLAKRRQHEDDCEEDMDTDVPESMDCGN